MLKNRGDVTGKDTVSEHGGDGFVVGLDDLRGAFQLKDRIKE